MRCQDAKFFGNQVARLWLERHWNVDGAWSGGSPQGPDDVDDVDGDSDGGTSDNRLIRTLAYLIPCHHITARAAHSTADLPVQCHRQLRETGTD